MYVAFVVFLENISPLAHGSLTVNEWALPRVCRRDPGQRHPLWSPLKPPTSFQAYSCVLSSQQAPQQVLCLPSAIGKALHDNLKSPILISPSSLHFIKVQIYFAQQKHRKNCECCPGHYLSTSVY